MTPGFLYHWSLWLINAVLYVLLDAAKQSNSTFVGMPWSIALANFSLVALFMALGSGLVGLISWQLGRVLSLAWIHGLVFFLLITINLWSLKMGFAGTLEVTPVSQRTMLAGLSLGLALLASGLLARSFRKPFDVVRDFEGKVPAVPIVFGALLMVGILASPSPSKGEEGGSPNVLLITFDALTAKNMGCYGYQRRTTPNLDRFAEQSLTIERFYANFTATGLVMPSYVGYMASDQQRGPDLIQVLKSNGYPNRAFFGYWQPEVFGLEGFTEKRVARTFMETSFYRAINRMLDHRYLEFLASVGTAEFSYYNPYNSDYHDDIFWTREHYPGQLTLKAAIEYLQAHPSGSFVWAHIWEPHYPYTVKNPDSVRFGPFPDPVEPFINRSYPEEKDAYVALLRNLYDQRVWETDALFGDFWRRFEQSGLADDTVVIVTSDHGESFERGYVGHSGWPVLEPITHVPLIIRRPGETPARVSRLSHQLDFAPTLLDILDIEIPKEMRGESLFEAFSDPQLETDRVKISISKTAALEEGDGGQIALYWRNYKLVYISTAPELVRLFDLEADPGAVQDVSAQHPEIVKEIFGRVGIKGSP